jgi:hypothetical protein
MVSRHAMRSRQEHPRQDNDELRTCILVPFVSAFGAIHSGGESLFCSGMEQVCSLLINQIRHG